MCAKKNLRGNHQKYRNSPAEQSILPMENGKEEGTTRAHGE